MQLERRTMRMQRARLSMLVGVFIYALFGVVDWLVIPDVTTLAWTWRYAVVCPAFALMWVLSQWGRLRNVADLLFVVPGILAGVGIAHMAVSSRAPGANWYFAGEMLVCQYALSFSGLPLRVAAGVSAAVVAAYIGMTVLAGWPPTAILIQGIFLVTAALIAILHARMTERDTRRIMALQRAIERESIRVQILEHDNEALRALARMCTFCRRIHLEPDQWVSLERFFEANQLGDVSHDVCPDCSRLAAAGLKPRRGD